MLLEINKKPLRKCSEICTGIFLTESILRDKLCAYAKKYVLFSETKPFTENASN